ncbi:MAG: TolC family protein [Paraprevotella sp.]|nr:TolC family protein [Paraprevotella sp.]
MKKTFLIITVAFSTPNLRAQTNDIASVLQAIEQNNTTLQALHRTAEAQQLENRTSLTLADPEIGYSYVWGSPISVNNKQNVSVSQTFDMATLSGLKNKVAGEKDKLIECQYRTDRMNILLEAKLYCLDLIYYNAMLAELHTRLEHAKATAEGQKERLENGDGNRLECNNVMLKLSTLKSEITLMKTERETVLSQLSRLNGGKPVDFTLSDYEDISMPTDFQEWFSMAETKNPALAYVHQDIEVSKKELSLSKTMNLPTVSLGYEGEFENGGDRHQGIAVGMSVPLWSNKNRVRQAKAAVRAAEARQTDTREQWYGNLKILYRHTNGLKTAAEAYRSALSESDNTQLLKTALDEGEISVLDYLVGISIYYDAVDKALEAERAYQKAYAELSAMEL